METVLLSTGTLSRFIVIRPNAHNMGYAYMEKDGFAVAGESSVVSPLVKIEAQRATINERYVNLRFCHTNKYWAQKDGKFIVAESNVPEEDITKPSCTLFEAVNVPNLGSLFYLNHVQSGGRLMVDQTSLRFYLNLNPPDFALWSFLIPVNWDTLVKLPKHVAFKGYNDKYLQGFWTFNSPHLEFAADDPNMLLSGYEITQMNDGHVRIFSNHFTKYWRRDDRSTRSGWIFADSTDVTDTTANNRDTLFWPVKIDDNTIALRNAGNNNFCKAFTADGRTNCLDAASTTITNEARLVVQELVMGRRLYNVRYRMEQSRIFNEKPFTAGTTTAFNYSDSAAGIAVEVGYVETRSRSFSRSLSLTAGVTSTIEFGLPLITGGSISVSYEISTTLEWNDTTTTETSVKATGSVAVPPRSLATINYVGTMGTCDIPFSYTQQDTSSTDGRIIDHENIDGVYTGVNAYNFSFVVEKTVPL